MIDVANHLKKIQTFTENTQTKNRRSCKLKSEVKCMTTRGHVRCHGQTRGHSQRSWMYDH